LSVNVNAALRLPLADGLKVTETVQFAAGARELPHVLLWTKSPAFVPVMAMPVMARTPLPVFVAIRDCGEEDV